MPAHPLTADQSFFATCPRNTEGLLLAEIRGLGVVDARETRAGIAFTATLPLAYRVCLWSRVASRVLMQLTSFPAVDPDDLYEGAGAVAWEEHLAASGTLAVEATTVVRQGPLANLNTHFAEQRVKDAVVDRFRARTGTRPGVDLARPDVRIYIHLTPEEALVSLDLSGEGLHKDTAWRAGRLPSRRTWPPPSSCARAGRRSQLRARPCSIPCAARARCSWRER